MQFSRQQALDLLREKIKTDYTIKHCIASEAIMRALAERLQEDVDMWGITGLLHDIDLEEVQGDMSRHGLRTAEILREMGMPEKMINAVVAHNGDVLGVQCSESIEFALTAAESVSGLIIATALIIPSKKLADVKPQSVIKRMKEKRFAANVSRERINQYAGLGLSAEEFTDIAVKAMQGIADQIGL